MKIAVLVAPKRFWRWQRALVEHLQHLKHEVIVAPRGAARVPLAVQALLKLEHWIFKGPRVVVTEDAHAPTDVDAGAFDVVIDLSGAGEKIPGALTLLYDGQCAEEALWGRLLRQQSPLISIARHDADGGMETLAASYAAIEDKVVLSRGIRYASARAALLIERAIEIVQGQRRVAPLPEHAHAHAVYFSHAALVRFVWLRCAAAVASAFHKRGHWITVWRRGDDAFTPISADGRFLADPFVVAYRGADYLFAEDLIDGGPKGRIVAGRLPDVTQSVHLEPVLTEAHHLSFPFVFEHEGDMFMMPEGGTSGSLSVYRAAEFPTRWEKFRDVMEHTRAFDPAIVEHAGRFWLFCTIAPSVGSTWDEISIFHGPSPFGPWTPHALNPVKSDVRGARMAGRFHRVNGRLLRPAQDCEQGYGAKLAWYEVMELTPETFIERRIGAWDPALFGDFNGLHTYDGLNDIQVIDLKLNRPRRGAVRPRIVGGRDLKVPDAH